MINTLTLNPAIDHIFYLDRLERNVTNRLRSTAVSVGGKGTHVSVNLKLMGSDSRAFGFTFGRNGEKILEMLKEAEVSSRFVHGEGQESRDNYLLVEEKTRDCTLITQTGPMPDEEQLSTLIDVMAREIQPGDDLLLSGDVSNFGGRDIYAWILERLSDKKLRVFLDASGETLRAGITRKPFLIKPNLDELAALTGSVPGSFKEVAKAIGGLDALGIEVIAVSLGGSGSLVRAEGRLYHAAAPNVAVYNTVGCGDCYMAGLIHAFDRGFSMEEAICCATAVSAAKAENPLSVGFELERARELMESVSVELI
ncbi:MAG: 1-phosphofructokinase family hexose kinase [Eubacteriales bacterium]|nr:1-phosphofructokinase family hexose kinase [Eubacteriales bacterium]